MNFLNRVSKSKSILKSSNCINYCTTAIPTQKQNYSTKNENTTPPIKNDLFTPNTFQSIVGYMNKPFEGKQSEYSQTHHSVLNMTLDQLIEMYKNRKVVDLSHVPTLDPQDVFVNGELKLAEVDVFGFDYDYTLANYSDQVQHLIYDLATSYLVDEQNYPAELKNLKYDSFAIRGLHFDMNHGLLMKLDFLNNIQPGAIYHGRKSLTKEQVIEKYGSMQLKKYYCENFLKPMSDIFCLPEACLISNTIQYLTEHNLSFEPRIIYEDVTKAVGKVHLGGGLHDQIIENLPLYLNKHPLLGDFLLKLKKAGKKLFLLTNNSYYYANHGMKYLLNDQLGDEYTDWTDLFDVIITQCDKPSFFGKGRPFRLFDPSSQRLDWREVSEFTPKKVYVGGSLKKFTEISKWRGRSVMYFGDHLFSDLVEPSLREGWKTVSIIKELETEVAIQNSPKYREQLADLLQLEDVIRRCQFFKGEKKDLFLEKLKQERYQKRIALKEPFNPNFGSIFRTHSNPTSFALSIQRYGDLYTSKIENFTSYPLNYVFYPSRNYLPHEFKLN
ncbi:hypothetical protein DICPUDRAFT_160087 [Dictyostelium purpureum]|uniref:5'-nucleotidase n=1 Tax=Dictyostelium purpureum TaxID=5786 RepID=F1A5P3_DICPU|nr:uncharacterized protein DICPUDRAFT_160087 [Dictyostelium purpureum]EGC28492.1 hypothetical protein DICPUDRAFT_160087 [Dictyostelium purpureum]|eukprot:XP_003294987.1 hypothetical protein DICPUDRAFT_160087 [Dictyostelium purpureum]